MRVQDIRRVLRASLLLVHMLIGVVIVLTLLRPRPGRSLPMLPVVLWSRGLCHLLGVRIKVSGTPRRGMTLFVANHISWVDTFCVVAVCPTHFLAKQEIAGWPVFGWMCRHAGTVFIRRGEENAAAEAVEQMTWRMRQGGRMLIFPEGTTGGGEMLRRFYPRLFQTALLNQCPVQAVAIRYPHRQGVNPVVPFIDDDELLPHLWRMLGERRVDVEICFAEPLASAGRTRNSLATRTQAQIEALLQLPVRKPVRQAG